MGAAERLFLGLLAFMTRVHGIDEREGIDSERFRPTTGHPSQDWKVEGQPVSLHATPWQETPIARLQIICGKMAVSDT